MGQVSGVLLQRDAVFATPFGFVKLKEGFCELGGGANKSMRGARSRPAKMAIEFWGE
jgi:hypothetical protein